MVQDTPGKQERNTLQALIDAQHRMLQNSFEQVKMAQSDRDQWYNLWVKRVVLCEDLGNILSDVVADQASFEKMLPRTQDAVKRMLVYLGDS